MKRGLIAGLALLVAFAIVGCDDGNKKKGGNTGDGKVTVSFNLNWPSGTAPAAPASVKVDKDTGKLTSGQIPVPTSAQKPTGKDFVAWFDTNAASGGGQLSTNTTFSKNTTYFARWKDADAGGGKDRAGVVEKVSLKNSWQVVYKFTLAANKTWNDYEKFSVSYLVEEEEADLLESGVARCLRVYGQYHEWDFEFVDGAGDADGHHLAVINWSSSTGQTGNNPFLMIGNGGGYSANFTDTINAKIGEDPEVEKWFTVDDYTFMKGVDPAYVDENRPKPTDTGPFYFGLGIPGQDNVNTLLMRRVSLVGKVAADTIVATPVVFKDGETLYPAFVGYGYDPSSDNGFAEAGRVECGDTEYKTPIVRTAAATYTVTFNYNYPDGVGTQPQNKVFTTSAAPGLVLSSANWDEVKAPAAPAAGWVFMGWNTLEGETAAGSRGVAIADGNYATMKHTKNRTFYGSWSEKTPATTPLVVTRASDPAFVQTAHYNNFIATYDSVSGKATLDRSDAAGVIAATEFSLFVTGAHATTLGGSNGSLTSATFPAIVESGDYLYNKVKISYTLIKPTTIETADGTKTVTPNASVDYKVIVKQGVGTNTDVSPAAYPSLTVDASNKGSITLNYSVFNPALASCGFQINDGCDAFLLRIDEIEFSYVE
jgi:hypothetical protein